HGQPRRGRAAAAPLEGRGRTLRTQTHHPGRRQRTCGGGCRDRRRRGPRFRRRGRDRHQGGMTMLTVTGVSKTFFPGTVNERRALNDLSLTLAEGDFVTVIGSNGAGKSTLLNAVSGRLLADSGNIEI